jgi:hypothetical protein
VRKGKLRDRWVLDGFGQNWVSYIAFASPDFYLAQSARLKYPRVHVWKVMSHAALRSQKS